MTQALNVQTGQFEEVTTPTPTVDAALELQLLRQFRNAKLAETDWYIIRNADTGDAVPSDITDARAAIRTSVATKESEINAKTTKAQVVQYDISL